VDFKAYYDAYWAGKDDAFDSTRLALMKDRVPGGCRVLEVGCGPGILGKLLVDEGIRVVGADLSTVALRRAREKGVLAIQCDPDGKPLPFRKDTFAFAASNSSLEHLFQPEHALREIHRVLRPEGTFLWMVPNIGHWHFRLWLLFGRFPSIDNSATDPLHIRMYTVREAKKALQAAGFKIRAVTGSAGTWVPRLYPTLLRAPGVRHVYERLAPWWPGLLCRYLLLEAVKIRAR
jgi:SAM-dependent methyltransferase